ncbi:MAG: DUF1398 family protein [Microbacteriaceae bacterium]
MIELLEAAQRKAMAVRPKTGGFPYLAEALREAGVSRNTFDVASGSAIYVIGDEAVIQLGLPACTSTGVVPRFDRESLIAALRADQAGEASFPEFLRAAWAAGVVHYELDTGARTVTYNGARGESYVEEYESVRLPEVSQ